MIKNNQTCVDVTSVCSSLMLNAGILRQNGPITQLKINKRKRVTLTDNGKTVTNNGEKRFTGKLLQ